ncbi:MAG: FecR protein [Pseudomonas sp.]|nr:FecR protein [Pseudomonas sp.]
MTDSESLTPSSLANEVLSDPVMDQALNWLIELECATAERRAEFEAWLTAAPAHSTVFASAEALWNSNLIAQAASRL